MSYLINRQTNSSHNKKKQKNNKKNFWVIGKESYFPELAHYIIKRVQFSTTTKCKSQKESGNYKHTQYMHMPEKKQPMKAVPEQPKILYLLPKYQYLNMVF